MGKPLKQANRDIRRKTQSLARHAAAAIMNDLAEVGPNWSGEFSNSWVADAPGVGKGKQGSYPYTIRDTPTLPDTIAASRRNPKLIIVNTTDYAMAAMDLEEGKFENPGTKPKGDIVIEGRRAGRMRTDIIEPLEGKEPTSFATAEPDWFVTYTNGGGMQKSLEHGVKIAFASEN
jgi:hypothetical protein